MILTGLVERVGGGRVRGKYETVDAFEVKGYPEYRKLNGTSYIMDHLRSSVGSDATVAISNHILIAVKRDGRVYAETGFKTIINSAGAIVALLIFVGTLYFLFVKPSTIWLLGPVLFILLWVRLRWLVAKVSRG